MKSGDDLDDFLYTMDGELSSYKRMRGQRFYKTRFYTEVITRCRGIPDQSS